MTDVPEAQHRLPVPDGRSNQRVIPATCAIHGAAGFTNLAVTKRGDDVEFDPHVAGSCVITLDEDGARVLFEALGEWLG